MAGERGVRRRAWLVGSGLSITFVVFRGVLALTPNTDLNIGSHNVHHLFVGLLILTVCGVPAVMFSGGSRLLDAARFGFGVGLGMALDEWVYLIATDGSNASYLLPVSFWGGLLFVGAAVAYVTVLAVRPRRSPPEHTG